MPFAPIEALPQENPAVRIFLTGLMILDPATDSACQIFVNSSATRHYLTIEVRRKIKDRPDEIMMRHVGPLTFVGSDDNPQNPPIHGLFIQKITEGEKGVKRYTGNATGSNGEESFDLAIDMASPTFYNGNPPALPDLVTGAARNLLDIDNLVGRPSIFLDDGILYTATKTRGDLTITLKQRNQQDRVLDRFASVIGANLYLDDEEHALLTWRNQGKLAQLQLNKPAEGVSYEIYVVNDPLYESDAVTDPIVDPKHDEFAEYYKLLTAVRTDDQFRLHVQPAAPGVPVERGSTTIPCMPVTTRGT
jgi:hypothetical protein